MDRRLVTLEEMNRMLKDMIREERERQMNRRFDVLDEMKVMLREMVREKQRQEGMNVIIDGSEALKTTLPSQSAMEDRRLIRIYVDLYGFDGITPEDWIAQAEYFFTNRGTQDDLKFPMTFVRMVGPAYDWVRRLRRQIPNLSWEWLKLEMINSFSTFHTTPVLDESYYEDVVDIEEAEAKGPTIQVLIEEEEDILPEMVNGDDNIFDSTEISTVEDSSIASNMVGIDAEIPAIGAIEEPREEESKIEDIKQGVVTGGSHQMEPGRLGMGTNMYPSSALLGQNKDKSVVALPIDKLIEKADGFAGVFPEHKYEIVKLEVTIFGVPASATYRAIWNPDDMLETEMFGAPASTTYRAIWDPGKMRFFSLEDKTSLRGGQLLRVQLSLVIVGPLSLEGSG